MGVTIRPIPGINGYGAGEDGLIYSLWRKCVGKGAMIGDTYRALSPTTGKDGYPRLVIPINGKKCGRFVHVLVALAWHGVCPGGMEVAHKDGNRTNSRPDNLEYKTHVANMADCIAHGTIAAGERHGNATLSDADIDEIKRLRADGFSCREVGRLFSVSSTHVSRIDRGVQRSQTSS